MRSFLSFLVESKVLRAYDLDDTLFTHNKNGPKIRDKATGKPIANKQASGPNVDFSDFSNTERLKKSAQPVKSMIHSIRRHQNLDPNSTTEIITARRNMDNKMEFGRFLRKHGINFKSTHVRRTGNNPGTPSQTKSKMLSNLIRKNHYKTVHLYDDDPSNISAALKLRSKHQGTQIIGHQVTNSPSGTKIKIRRF